MGTITSANSDFRLIPVVGSAAALLLPALAGVGFPVQGYATDDAFATDMVETAIARMGVDARMSAGWVPRLTPQQITLQSDSPSIPLFEALVGAQDSIREVIFLNGALALPSVNTGYALTNGVLTRITPVRPAKRVLEPVQYEITWESCVPAPLA